MTLVTEAYVAASIPYHEPAETPVANEDICPEAENEEGHPGRACGNDCVCEIVR